MQDLATAVLLAAKYNQRENMSLEQSADKAAGDVGFDEHGTAPVYMLLAGRWNESLEWAVEVLGLDNALVRDYKGNL